MNQTQTEKPKISTADPRQMRAFAEGHEYDVRPVSAGLWTVTRKGRAAGYRVNLTANTCTCADHVRRGVDCKHIHRVRLGLLLGELKAPQAPAVTVPKPGTKAFARDWE